MQFHQARITATSIDEARHLIMEKHPFCEVDWITMVGVSNNGLRFEYLCHAEEHAKSRDTIKEWATSQPKLTPEQVQAASRKAEKTLCDLNLHLGITSEECAA